MMLKKYVANAVKKFTNNLVIIFLSTYYICNIIIREWMGMGWKRFKEDYKKEIARMEAKDEAKRQAKEEKRQQQMELNPPKAPLTQQERLAKRGNILLTGFSLWFLAPVFAIVLILVVAVGFSIYDWVINLF
jgi:hypothetical protein